MEKDTSTPPLDMQDQAPPGPSRRAILGMFGSAAVMAMPGIAMAGGEEKVDRPRHVLTEREREVFAEYFMRRSGPEWGTPKLTLSEAYAKVERLKRESDERAARRQEAQK